MVREVLLGAALVCVALVWGWFGTAMAATDLAGMSVAEVAALQGRLAAAGCYKGAADGVRSAALDRAIKACPDQQPKLTIETGMHTAIIERIGVDAACRTLVTGSHDKTLRLWSLPDGKPQRVIRLPIEGTNGGKIFAVALSPDGRHLAAGGWDVAWEKLRTSGLYLIDLTTGDLRRVGTFAAVVLNLAFSADGRRIAVGLADKNGVRVLDRDSGRELLADRDYAGAVSAVVFGRDGSLATTSYDGFVRRYGPDLKRTTKLPAPGGSRPRSIALDPTGKRIAVGYLDSPAVSILDAASLRPLAEADTADLSLDRKVLSVSWSTDGSTLSAGGSIYTKERRFLRFFTAGGRSSADVPVSADSVLDLRACGDDFYFAAADPSFGLVRQDKTAVTLQAPRTTDMRGKRGASFTLAADGLSVRFGLGVSGLQPVLFDLQGSTLADAPVGAAGLNQPLTEGLPVTDWGNSLSPKFQDRQISLYSYETSRSLAVRRDRSGFVLGAEFSLRSFDAAGAERWRKPVPGIAWGVNLSADGRIVVAAHGDGTIRWYRWSDGQELLAMFVEAPTKRWVAWTPSGYYMASPGGEDLIGWHLNRGWEQEADFFPASRFREKFNRPDIVRQVLVTLDEAKAVAAANAAANRKPEAAPPITTRLPPVINIVSPAGSSQFNGGSVQLEYTVRSPSGLVVDKVEVLIDGRTDDGQGATSSADCPVLGNRGAVRTDLPAAGKEPVCQIRVQLPAKDVEVGLIARSGTLASVPAVVKLAYAGQMPALADILKPKLYVLAIGVADYIDPGLRLNYAGKDANDFAAAMKGQEGGLYGTVEVRPLTDRAATRDSVLEGLEWLEKQVTSRDVGVVFLAGHGQIDDAGRFWYLPSDASVRQLRTRGVSQDDIRATLRRIAGKAVLFLDACHAAGVNANERTRGQVDINSVVSDFTASENGVVVFGSSTGRELSIESSEWGNGAFTRAVVEGIKDGKADLLAKGTITLSELDVYVAERVKALTNGRQHPVMAKPGTIPNFTFAIRR